MDTALAITEMTDPSADTLRAYWTVSAAARGFDQPLVPAQPFEELLAENDVQRSVRRHRWVAHAGDRPVGLVLLELPALDNTDAAHATIEVHPAHRRRGIGRRLLELVLERMRAEGRSHLIADVAEPLDRSGSAGSAFAAAMGAANVLEDVCRVLELADISEDQLADAQSEAAAHSPGYEFVQWTGPCPDEVVDDLAALTGRLISDAPTGDLDWEPETWDRDRVREKEDRNTRLHRGWVTTAARHTDSGRLVAYTDMGWSRGDEGTAYQWTTIVDRAHRGHRLGLLVKAGNLLLLHRQLPAAKRVVTWNAEANTHMIAINEALGFRPQLRFAQWQLHVSP